VTHRQREANLCPVETDTLIAYGGGRPRGLCRLIGIEHTLSLLKKRSGSSINYDSVAFSKLRRSAGLDSGLRAARSPLSRGWRETRLPEYSAANNRVGRAAS
jgi:hypothetical protein